MKRKRYEEAEFYHKKLQKHKAIEDKEWAEKTEIEVRNLLNGLRKKQLTEQKSIQNKIDTGMNELMKNRDMGLDRLTNKVRAKSKVISASLQPNVPGFAFFNIFFF